MFTSAKDLRTSFTTTILQHECEKCVVWVVTVFRPNLDYTILLFCSATEPHDSAVCVRKYCAKVKSHTFGKGLNLCFHGLTKDH